MIAKLKEWPNGLGYDLGRDEIWKFGTLKGIGPNGEPYAWGIRVFNGSRAYKHLLVYTFGETPNDLEFRVMVRKCRRDGEFVKPVRIKK